MATTKQKKKEIIEYLETNAVNQKCVVLLSTKNTEDSLNSEKNSEFRKETRAQGIIVKVVKNSLVSKLFPSIPEKLSGQTYVAFAEDGETADEVTVPKIVVKLATKEFEKNFTVVGALVNGEFVGSQEAQALSNTASKKDSMAMVAGTINSIIARTAIAIKEVNSKLARAVNEVSKQKA